MIVMTPSQLITAAAFRPSGGLSAGTPLETASTPVSAVRLGDWKLLEYFEDQRVELFNLRDDPGEHRNLAGEQPELVWRAQGDAPETWMSVLA